MKSILTTCPYCGAGCTFYLNVEGGKIISVTPNAENSVNEGKLCLKGHFGFDFVHHPDRLTTPLIKRDGQLVEASWDEAIGLVASKLKEIKEKHGSDSIAAFSSARCTNEENYLMQKMMRATIGTNNIDCCARLCHAPTVAGLAIVLGSGAMTNSIHELKKMNAKDAIFVIGSNTTETQPIVGIYILQAKAQGAQLVVADPREIELARHADVWLRQKPGTDVALLNGIMNVIITEGLADESFIAQRTENYQAAREVIIKYTPEYAETITTVPAEKIRQAARIYAKAENASVYYTMGITQHTNGVDNVFCLANLTLMTGNLGKEKAGLNPLRGQNNVQGACDMGALPSLYPGYQSVADPAIKEKFEKAWNVKLSAQAGLTIPDIFQGIEEDKVKALYVLGENPMRSDPNINHVKHCLEQVDFLVVQDIFLTETAAIADVVFPGASFAEKDGTFTNTERRVQRVRKAVEPIGNSKADWQILANVMEAMGYPASYLSAEDVFTEMAKVTPSYGGITYSRIENTAIAWPCPTEEHPGTPILHVGKFSRGRGKFSPVEFRGPAENPDEEYPLILTTGRVAAHYHTGTMTRRSWGLNSVCPEEALEIHPDDAARLGIKDGDKIRVASRRGELLTKANVTSRVPAGTTFITFHFTEAPGNILTNNALDPVCKTPEFKVCAVKVEKIS